MGSIATADTLYAVDGPYQDGTADTNTLAPMARLMGAGDVLVEYDQRYEHYGVPHPLLLAQLLSQTPLGLSDPTSFGTPGPTSPPIRPSTKPTWPPRPTWRGRARSWTTQWRIHARCCGPNRTREPSSWRATPRG